VIASRFRILAPLLVLGLVLTACAGSTGGEGGSVDVSSATPASGSAPRLGSATVGAVTVSGVAMHGSGTALTVTGTITSTQADALASIGSNYTETSVLRRLVAIPANTPFPIDAGTTTLRPTGRIDPGATVAVEFTFQRTGNVQVFVTYTP
jgi:hypothetical protein